MDELFKEQAINIRIYMAVETVNDPYEKTVEINMLPSLPIKAIVTDVAFAKIQYAMPGIVTDKVKEIIIKKKYRSLIEKSQKITIAGDFYEGWRQNSRMQIREEGNFLRIYVYIKKV